MSADPVDRIAAVLALSRDRRISESVERGRELAASCGADGRPLVDSCRALVEWRAAADAGRVGDGLIDAIAGIARLEDAGYRPLLGWAFSTVGLALGLLGDFESGVEWCQRAIDDADERGDRARLVISYCNMGIVLGYADELDHAAEYFATVLTLCDGRPDVTRVMALSNLAYCRILTAQRAETSSAARIELAEAALQYAAAALEAADALPHADAHLLAHAHAEALCNQGNALCLLGRYAEAEAAFVRGLLALDPYPQTDVELTVSYAGLLIETGEHARAAALLDQAIAKAQTDLVDRSLDHALELKIRLAHLGGRIADVGALWEERFRLAQKRYGGRLRNVRRYAHMFGDLARARAAEKEARAQAEALRAAKQAAEAASAAKGEFVANMSHEIRTPLNAILGLAQILDGTMSPGEQRDVGERIQDAGAVLLRSLNDVLDLSKIEAGQLDIEHQPFDVVQVLARAENLMGGTARKKGLALRIDAAECAGLRVVGDAVRIDQVLLNLLSNAIKFTARGEIVLAVRPLAPADASPRLHFEVRDPGIGIAADKLAFLFTPFTQADSSITRRFGGTGLGLSISKRLAELMGGSIGVDSVEGVGSTFWFDLPFVRVAGAAPAGADGGPARPVSAAVAQLAGLRVLVVDDSPMNLDVIERMLRRQGAAVVLAGDGQQALQALAAEPGRFDVVLMDIQMPVMDGLCATRAIRSDPVLAAIPVFALSAGVSAEERAAATTAGADGFITKPIDLRQLAAALAPTGLGRHGRAVDG